MLVFEPVNGGAWSPPSFLLIPGTSPGVTNCAYCAYSEFSKVGTVGSPITTKSFLIGLSPLRVICDRGFAGPRGVTLQTVDSHNAGQFNHGPLGPSTRIMSLQCTLYQGYLVRPGSVARGGGRLQPPLLTGHVQGALYMTHLVEDTQDIHQTSEAL